MELTNKTYTAPDGSVYRIEPDGSVTKIKNGRTQQPQEGEPKYTVTPDGKIFMELPDGTRKFVGYSEIAPTPPVPGGFPPTVAPKQKKSRTAPIWIILLILLAIGGLAAYLINEKNNDQYTDNYSNSDYNYESAEEATESPAADYNYGTTEALKETPAVEDAKTRFMNNGSFYGYIDGYRITGYIYFYDEEPYGYYQYDGDDSGPYWFYRQSYDHDVWQVYRYDDPLGSITFKYWNLYSSNFAWGDLDTEDGCFSIDLYQTDF